MYTGVAPHQKSLHVIIEEVLPEVISFATLDDELDMALSTYWQWFWGPPK